MKRPLFIRQLPGLLSGVELSDQLSRHEELEPNALPTFRILQLLSALAVRLNL